ncbi:ADP-ribosylation factor-like protein 1 [Pancytospora epiphaga]|nr:ADP-ribosylation factor-like protein 1 [Pancytospora epiphaga]
MGNVFSLFRRTKKILILGAKGSGKTKILKQIARINKLNPKLNNHRHFNFLKIKNYNIWDLSGDTEMVSLWPYYFDNANCIIFVYDVEKAEESENLLQGLCYAKELRHTVILIVINKFVSDSGEPIRIGKIMKHRVFQCTYINNNKDKDPIEMKQGFDWIMKNV